MIRVKRWPPVSLLVAYLLFGAFVISESRMRQGREASTLQAGEHDQRTTRLVGTAFGAGLLLTPVLTMLRPRRHVPAYVGPGVMLLAIALRTWAAAALGRFYTRTLRTAPDQQVVRIGPYRFVRHPGYLADLTMWVGFGLSTRDWLPAALWGGVMSLVYQRRMNAEEAMLRQELGQAYVDYAATTPRLIPAPPGLR